MNILFTGIGGPTPLGLAKSIKDAFPSFRCIGIDGSEWSTNLYDSDIFDSVYKVQSATNQNYWKSISDIVEKESIDFAFVVPETEVLEWSKYQLNNDLPCKSLIPDFNLAQFCFDKSSVANLLFQHDLTPFTIALDATQISEKENLGISYPFWIRVKSGAGALGALKINSFKDLKNWLNLHENRNDFIASEFLPGRNYACKLLYVNDELIQTASGERIDYLLSAAAPSGISGMCARGRILNRPDLVQKSMHALDIIKKHLNSKLNGIFTVDFKEDSSGKALITEINIRHVSFNYAYSLGGINFAETTVNKVFYNLVPSQVHGVFENEFFFIRGVDAPIRLIKTNTQ